MFQNLPVGLFCVSLSQKAYWKVSVQYLLFSSFLITTDPGLRLSRMTTLRKIRGHPELVSGSAVRVVCRCRFVVLFKGVVSFFFFVKILINCGGRTRMYPPYKNAYKRPFCSNIKALTRRKNERI